jgi:RNA recognition motif-containing protein
MTTPATENKAMVFVSDLPATASHPDLMRMFEGFGKITNIRMLKDREASSGRKPAAIIHYESEESAAKAA